MLLNLKIENVAIIESADIVFDDGLNIMTGETGAGKSIIIDSINAVLGERTSRELVRTGCAKAGVTALFRVDNSALAPLFEELGIEPEDDGSLLIRRTISADGKNTCRINGVPSTVGMLKALGSELINIHGQHDSQHLLNPESHCEFIDKMADDAGLLEEYKAVYLKLIATKKEITALISDEEEKNRKTEYLTYQIDEIENANLTPGETDELKAQRTLHRNSERIISAVNSAYTMLDGYDEAAGAIQQIKMSFNQLDGASEFYPQLESSSNRLRDIAYELEEIQDCLTSALEELEYDPQYAQDVEARLDYLTRLGRKYGEDEQSMLDYCEECKRERENIELSDERLAQLKKEQELLQQQAHELASQLTQIRTQTGKSFAQKVQDELKFLDMPNVVFTTEISAVDLGENGADYVEFLISPNLGEAPKPLAKIASGGELSRIMLAIKNVLSDKDDIETLIFDEIDAGVSGRAATKLGKKLSEVSGGRQVICVTHLAQIAAQADHHFEISKASHDGKTFTSVVPLDFEGRKKELARIIGGEEITQTQLNMAEELLNLPKGRAK